MRTHIIHSLLPLLILALLLGACTQAIPQTGGDQSELRLELTDSAVTAPASASAGVTTVTLNNTSQTKRTVTLARLNTGVTVEQFTEQLATDDIAAVELVALDGGRNAPAGQTTQVTLDLEEGTYVVVAFPDSDGPPLLTNFQVGAAGAGQASPPTAGVTVDMGDFFFSMPDSVSADSAIWEVTNSGQQWHELVIFKPGEGFTQEQFLEMVMSDQPPAGEPPMEEIATFGPSSQGERGWLTLDLEPGRYWAVCFLPDLVGGGESHVQKGMFKEFTVP